MIESKLTAKGSKTIKMSAGTSRTNVAVTIFICRRSTPALSIKDFSNGIKEQFATRSDLRRIMPERGSSMKLFVLAGDHQLAILSFSFRVGLK